MGDGVCSFTAEVTHTSFEAGMKEVGGWATLGVALLTASEAVGVCPTSSEALIKPVTPSLGCEMCVL